jgi:hypothetical protein
MTMRTAVLVACLAAWPAPAPAGTAGDADFPSELVDFVPYAGNPVFAGLGRDTWDRQIRERGYILKEGNLWRLWYTGYNYQAGDVHRTEARYLGYATSPDGLRWTRYSDRPIFDKVWTEDVQVLKHGDLYWMFAEGRFDIAHWLTSSDGIEWKEEGSLDIHYSNGKPLSPGPYGTPCVWFEGGRWYLFYERGDRGIWLAASADGRRWTNLRDEPVIRRGPEPYDKDAVALNQVVKYRGKYYGYYHGNGDRQHHGPWTTSVAMSSDLVHWTKYAKNPIIPTDHSSAILVDDGRQYRLYTMHPAVWAWFPRRAAP